MTRETTNGEATYYIWGLDLSGTLQGAGGVGGLLAEITPDTVRYPFCDGNGNITDWVDDDGEVIAHYEYDAFGNPIAPSGEPADANPYRFSTKYLDETGLYYYGYRFYSPAMGRWLNRDPIEEEGGENVYGSNGNDSVNQVDILGMAWKRILGPERHALSGGDHPYSHYERWVKNFFGSLKDIYATIFSKQTLNQLGVSHYSYPNGRDGIWNGSYTLRLSQDIDQGLCRVSITYQIKPYKAPFPPKADINYGTENTEYFENSCPCDIMKVVKGCD